MNRMRPSETRNQLVGLGARRTDVLAAEVGPLDFDDLGMPHDAQPGVDLSQGLRRGRLSGAGWTDEEHVVGLVGQRQPGRHPQGPDLDLVLDLGHRPFDFTHPT